MRMRQVIQKPPGVEELDCRILEDHDRDDRERREPQTARPGLEGHRHEPERHAHDGETVEDPRRLALVQPELAQNSVMQMIRKIKTV